MTTGESLECVIDPASVDRVINAFRSGRPVILNHSATGMWELHRIFTDEAGRMIALGRRPRDPKDFDWSVSLTRPSPHDTTPKT